MRESLHRDANCRGGRGGSCRRYFNTNDRLRTELREKLKKQRALRDKGSTGEPTVKDSEHKQDDHIADFRKQGEYGAKKNIKP